MAQGHRWLMIREDSGMNLFTAQRNYRIQEAEAVAEVIDRRTPIMVHASRSHLEPDLAGDLSPVSDTPGHAPGDLWTDEYGPVHGAHSRSHSDIVGWPYHSAETDVYRPCVHTLEPPVQGMLFTRQWVCELNWLPTIYILGPCPVVAARRSDIVTVSFDVVGPVDNCRNTPTALPENNRWSYKLFPFIFDDCDGVYPDAWLGIWND